MLGSIWEGTGGHGPTHLLCVSARDLGWAWDCGLHEWARPGLPSLSMLSEPIQHFDAAILQAWRGSVARVLCKREGFREGPHKC